MGINDKNSPDDVAGSSPAKQEQSKPISGINVDHFLSNSKDEIVRKASDYIYIGFRRHCQLEKFAYRAEAKEWLERFTKYLTGGK